MLMQTHDGHRVIFKAPREVVLEPIGFQPPGPGQALLRTERTLISTGTELTALTGDFPPNSRWSEYIQFPTAIGYSQVGTVLAVGEGVTGVQVGERVGSTAHHGTHALFPAERLWRVPPEVDAEAASFATLAEIVMGGVRRSRLMFGESVAIVGVGLLGQLAARFCRTAGAWPVIVLDPAGERLPTALAMGATHTLAATAEVARAEVEQLTKGRMPDVVFEVTGNPQAIPGALKLARRLGRVILLGSPRGPVSIDLHDEAHTYGLEIIGAHNSTHPPVETPHTPWTIARHVELFLDWQAAGVIDVRPLITHRYPWRQVPEAYRMLLEDRSRALGVVLDWSAE
jgi:2-desacetyl-2-hydroxyethyl bacteriochlorophyllide A dehydrogenase